MQNYFYYDNYVFNMKNMGSYRKNIWVNGRHNHGPFQIIDKTNQKNNSYVRLAQGHDEGCYMVVYLCYVDQRKVSVSETIKQDV